MAEFGRVLTVRKRPHTNERRDRARRKRETRKKVYHTPRHFLSGSPLIPSLPRKSTLANNINHHYCSFILHYYHICVFYLDRRGSLANKKVYRRPLGVEAEGGRAKKSLPLTPYPKWQREVGGNMPFALFRGVGGGLQELQDLKSISFFCDIL